MNLRDLLSERAHATNKARGMLDAIEKEKRDFTKAEEDLYNAQMAEIEELSKKIGAAELRKARLKDPNDTMEDDDTPRMSLDGQARQSGGHEWRDDQGRTFRHWNAEESAGGNKSAMEDISRIVRAQLDPKYKRDLTGELRAIHEVGQDQSGGYLLPTKYASELLKAARDTTIVAKQCRFVECPDGQSTKFAGVTTDPTASWSGEGKSLTEGSIVFQSVTLNPKRVGTYLTLSLETARAPNALTEIEKALRYAVARALDLAILQGDGDVEPLGLDGLTNIGSEDKAGSTISMDDIIEGYWGIRENNGPEAISMICNAQQGAKLSKLKDGEGQYLMTANGGTPDIWQYIRRYVTNLIPEDSSNYSTTYFGNFSESFLGYVPDDMQILVSREAYDGTNNSFTQGLAMIRILAWYDWNAGPHEDWFYRIYNASVA